MAAPLGVGAPHAALEDEVAAILPSRWSRARVSDAMWLIYHLRERSLSGLADGARNGANAAFQLQWHHDTGWIDDHPSLFAIQVESLAVETDPDTDIETLHYVTPPLYQERKGTWPPEVELVRKNSGVLSCGRVLVR